MILEIFQDSYCAYKDLTIKPKFFKNIILLSCLSTPQLKRALKTDSRVATDLENLEMSGNLKETSESQGICLKSQGICDRIPKVKEKSGNFVV